jgi:hypothetical protein
MPTPTWMSALEYPQLEAASPLSAPLSIKSFFPLAMVAEGEM